MYFLISSLIFYLLYIVPLVFPYQVNICKTDPNRLPSLTCVRLENTQLYWPQAYTFDTDYTNLIPGFCYANGFLVSSVHLCNTQKGLLTNLCSFSPHINIYFWKCQPKSVSILGNLQQKCCLLFIEFKNARIGSHLTSDVILFWVKWNVKRKDKIILPLL